MAGQSPHLAECSNRVSSHVTTRVDPISSLGASGKGEMSLTMSHDCECPSPSPYLPSSLSSPMLPEPVPLRWMAVKVRL